MNIKADVISAIDVRDFWKKEFPEWNGADNGAVVCPFHNDTNPSLALSYTGKAYCRSCGWKCTSVVGFYAERHCDGNFKKALAKLYSKYVQRIYGKAEWQPYVETLQENTRIQNAILKKRGWSGETINRFNLGWCGIRNRTVIPVYAHKALVVDLLYHDSLRLDKSKKRVPIIRSKDSKRHNFFPVTKEYNPFSKTNVWLFEGEPDTILAIQEGISGVTVTGGAGAWSALPRKLTKALEHKDVVICFDSDETGQNAAQQLAQDLAMMDVESVKIVTIPQGKDFTEWMLNHGGTAEKLEALADAKQPIYRSRSRSVTAVKLAESIKPEYIGSVLETNVLVNQISTKPTPVPKVLRLTCGGERCDDCPCNVKQYEDIHILPDDEDILEWTYTNPLKKVREYFNCTGKKSRPEVNVTEWQQIYQGTGIPALTVSKQDMEDEYIVRDIFFVTEKLHANKTYRLHAIPRPHPRNRRNVLIAHSVVPGEDSLRTFELEKSEVLKLKETLRGKDPLLFLKEHAENLSADHTQIKDRWYLHAGVDLAFHSLLQFEFDGVMLPKASLELLIVGDTRTGKGFIVEGMMRAYDLGYVVSGENATFMGLVGGLAKTAGGDFSLSWGALPLNHSRLVCIDEFSGLDKDILGKLSRVRSEGIAEIHKGGVHDQTLSNCRTIWISNPRDGVAMSEFSFGCEAIPDLVKAQEDIARYDLCFAVAKEDVSSTAINSGALQSNESTDYTLFRSLILWCWSRTKDQVVFTDEATQSILDYALFLSDIYIGEIPIIQTQNIRFKLAKIAAAFAGRMFNSPDGQVLMVEKEHADAAYKFIRYIYRLRNIGYEAYSRQQRKFADIDIGEVAKSFEPMDVNRKRMVRDGLLSSSRFRATNLAEWLNTDIPVARKVVGSWVRANALISLPDNSYKKKSAFTKWLQNLV